ncbi:MAG: metallophosphoesterase family protein [Oscillospiraceae bacterium]|nr:metallophosphoesterase family protein [Oscillospiraceae bacterium]
MNKNIRNLADRIFENIHYSKKSEDAREIIAEKLEKEYQKNLKSANEIQSEGILMQKYGDFSSAADFAKIGSEMQCEILNNENLTEKKALTSNFWKIRIPVYIFSVFSVLTAVSLFDLIFLRDAVYFLLTAAMSFPALIAFILYLRSVKLFDYSNIKLDDDSYSYLKKLCDKYSKRFVNSVFLLIGILFVVLITALMQYIKGFMTVQEIQQSMLQSLVYAEYIVMIAVKNAFCIFTLNRCFKREKSVFFQKSILIVLAASFGYWIISSGLIVFLSKGSYFYSNYIFIFAVIYVIAWMTYNLTLRGKLVFDNITLNIKRAVAFTLCIAFIGACNLMQRDTWNLQPLISLMQSADHEKDDISYNDETGVYTIVTEKENFRILQITDIHIGGSIVSAVKDYKAVFACYCLIKHTKPDLVIVTGDLVFPVGLRSFSLNNSAPIIQFASFMRTLGIPWAFTYGNHDTEDIANKSEEEITELFKTLSYKTSENLLYPYIQPNITGRSNQLIEIRNEDNSLIQAIFLMDSNDYTGEGFNDYDYIHDDQVEWYRQQVEFLCESEGRTISSLLFFHIPLQQYKTAYELYKSGSPEVKYYFGENGETMFDKVCCSDYPSGLFDTAVELGSTKAMFCGHDHYNNSSLEYKGIRLTYGMSIDYLAMPGIDKDTKQRGGTLITLHSDSSYDIEQIPLESIQNEFFAGLNLF